MTASFLTGLINQVIQTISGATTPLSSAISFLTNMVSNQNNSVMGSLGNAVNSITNSVGNITNSLYGYISQNTNSIIAQQQAAANAIKNTIVQQTQSVFNSMDSVVNQIQSIGDNGVLEAVTNVANIVSTIVNPVQQVEGLISTLRTELAAQQALLIQNSTDEIQGGVSAMLANAFSGVTDFFEPLIDVVENQIADIVNQQAVDIGDITINLESAMPDGFEFDNPFLDNPLDQAMADLYKLAFSPNRDDVVNELLGIPNLEARFDQLVTVADKLIHNGYDSMDEFWDEFNNIAGTGGLGKVIINGLIALPILFYGMAGIAQPYASNIHKLAREDAKNADLSPQDVVSTYHRQVLPYAFLEEQLGKLGYSDKQVRLLAQLGEKKLGPDDIRTLYLRGFMNEGQVNTLLASLGYNEVLWPGIKELFNEVPPVQDIITMAVREVFNPEVANRFGQFEDFPEDFARFAKMQGFSRDWARNYWAAHWTLPSPNQGFEMFQRRVINKDDLNKLLKAQDIMPFWRDKMTQIAYRVVTRVDARRMHQLGIFNDQQTYETYLDMGYSPERARDMLAFTIAYNSKNDDDVDTKDKALSRSVIVRAYTNGQITYADAFTRLFEMGYGKDDAILILNVADYHHIEDERQEYDKDNKRRIATLATGGYMRGAISLHDMERALKTVGYTQDDVNTEITLLDCERNIQIKGHISTWVKNLYVERTADENTARTLLGDRNFSPSEIGRLLDEWNILRETRDTKPSRTMVETWFKRGYISEEQFADELRGLGYAERYIPIMVHENREEM